MKEFKMNGILTFLIMCLITTGTYGNDFYSYSVKDKDGQDVSLENYRGKVTLVVNVASLCGYTDVMYSALTKLHDILSYEGFFSVLAFPCNQFAEQEPSDISEILELVQKEYKSEFPIFDKIEVIGDNASPAFRNLIEQSSVAPEWNFYKYLVDEDGKVIDVWGTKTTIEELFEIIQAAVNRAKDKDLNEPGVEEKPSDVIKDEL
ncbi:uncharacterized protein LOC143036580 [Oratosquilla oratoria]|uniref:uncharacterized protein LOC143036580 n=1 Tax=Oratosquilla oratoria TaxID=337810 RepID=UPI003F75E603